MRLTIGQCSDPGLVRPTNQDAYAAHQLDPANGAALLLVADGMGGYEGGEIASRLAIETVQGRLQSTAQELAATGRLRDGLVEAVSEANQAILQAQRERLDCPNMGTTLTAAVILGDRIMIGHIGDSKAYLIRPDGAVAITTDHNVAAELLQSGHLTAEQAAVHPQRHVLTRALGIEENVCLQLVEVNWQQGDLLLLCTDGLSNLVQLDEIQALGQEDAQALAAQLVGLANSRGGSDNITVLAARWEG